MTPRVNKILAAIREERKAYGIRLTIPSPELVDMLFNVAPDFILIDYEHGVFDLPSIENICRAAELIGATAIARVPDISGGTIVHMLDRGVQGIIGAHVASRQDAEALVKHCLYAPDGRRSFGGARGSHYQDGITDLNSYMRACNDQILIGAMLESREAIDVLDEILDVERINYFMFGPADFAQDMGFPGENDHPVVQKIMRETADHVRRKGRLMREDIMKVRNVKDIIISGAREFLKERLETGPGLVRVAPKI